MDQYIIERHIPGIGSLSSDEFRGLAAAANSAIAALGGKVQWMESFVTADNTFCVYFAQNEDSLREHSRIAGFPITRISKVARVIDPLTAHRPLGDGPARPALEPSTRDL